MNDIAASILDRLRNRMAVSNKDFQQLLRAFCQEEFLRRLEKSKYIDNFVLKGGFLLYSPFNLKSRVTVDIDFALRKIPNTPEKLMPVLEEIIATPTGNDFVSFVIKEVNFINLKKKYQGLRASMIACIKNTRTPFNIDFGVGDIVFPKYEKRQIPTQLPDFNPPIINTYSIESAVAEKLDAILDLLEDSSRMKDYYDVYYIANNFNFEGANLVKAIKKTFENREHSFTIANFQEVLSFTNNVKMNTLWNGFVKNSKIEPLDYNAVIKTIEIFLKEPFLALIENKGFTKHWSSTDNKWM